mmetsp:Transcript_44378/g.71063  ORF Transcript_44378/g.71063 Transcript_44378/m.71063 type:complete len:93 (-) Transcript_44378:50-328(-)
MSWRGALGKNLRELRFILGDTQGSKGARDFLQSSYAQLKVLNPEFPLLVREAQGTKPRVMARYANGKEKTVSLDNMKGADVEIKVSSPCGSS